MLKTQLREKSRLYNFKVTEDQLEAIKNNANLYANGKVSSWIRYAAMTHKPKKTDLVNPENTKT